MFQLQVLFFFHTENEKFFWFVFNLYSYIFLIAITYPTKGLGFEVALA